RSPGCIQRLANATIRRQAGPSNTGGLVPGPAASGGPRHALLVVLLPRTGVGREPGLVSAGGTLGASGALGLKTLGWAGPVMGTRARIMVVSRDAGAGEVALDRAVRDLEKTESVLSRFREDSELGTLNREGTVLAGGRLMAAVRASVTAYRWSGGLLDARVIDALEGFGYRYSLPRGYIAGTAKPRPLAPAEPDRWIDEASGRVILPDGIRLDLAGVGKALGIGWAARCLAGHAGLLVDVGGDVLALGTDEDGRPWRVAVDHDGGVVGEFSGSALAVATSTTARRRWATPEGEAHHLIDPRTGAPATSELTHASVAAPTILEADLAAKLLMVGGRSGTRYLDHRCRVVVTNREGTTEVLNVETGPAEKSVGA
ncbi:MAG: FAD:protein FMN transferase, partial [Rubrobacteraceae bacterium]